MSSRVQILRVLAGAACAVVCASSLEAQTLIRASVGPNGVEGDQPSWGAVLSEDGRWLLFTSSANNLVPGDVHDQSPDLILRDLVTGVNEFVVLDLLGQQSLGDPGSASISPDGRYVLFTSNVSTLVTGDTNGFTDVFLRDRKLGTNERVSLTWQGGEADGDCGAPSPGSMSDDARRVVFESGAKGLVAGKTTWWFDVFVRDRELGTTVCVSLPWNGGEADSASHAAAISGDGRCVLFTSDATNLVPGDTNGKYDLFLRDLELGTLERVNLSHDGLEADDSASGARSSRDGRWVCFDSMATNLVPGDTNGVSDVFLRDRVLGLTTRLDVSSAGAQAGDHSWLGAPASDARFVAFTSAATNLVLGDTNGHDDIYLHDRLSGGTSRVSLCPNGVQGEEFCDYAAISGDGRLVAFESTASNLVPDDHNRARDVFVVDRGPALVASYCVGTQSALGCTPSISARGTPSVSSQEPFTIRALDVAGRVTGILFYGVGPIAPAFQGSGACVAPPFRRTPATNSPAAGPCLGSLAVDFNAHVQSLPDPAALVGLELYCQWWHHDPKGASGSAFSDALLFTIQP